MLGRSVVVVTLAALAMGWVGRGDAAAEPPAPVAFPQGYQNRAQGTSAFLTVEYFGALRVLVTSGNRAAVEHIVALETANVDSSRPGDLLKLDRVKQSLVRRLTRDDAANLVPLMVLFHDAALEYRSRGEFGLGGSSSRLAVGVAERFVELSDDKLARASACLLASSFASGYLGEGALRSAQEYFDIGLRLDPRCEPALLGMGALAEVLGRYELAVAYFGRLRELRPDSSEARLRLGVNLARLGRGEQAADALRSCLEMSGPSWVGVVAYEELARVLADGGNPRAGIEVLRAAVDRYPAERGPVVALAHLLDRTGRQSEADGVLGRLAGIPAGGEASPRFTYCLWPLRDPRSLRDALEMEASRGLAALGVSLDNLQVELGAV